MHCDRRDILRWQRAKKLKKQAALANANRKRRNKSVARGKRVSECDAKVIRVIKADGRVILIEKPGK